MTILVGDLIYLTEISYPFCKFWGHWLCYKFTAPHTKQKSEYKLTTDKGIILCIRPANERRRYNVTSSLIGWATYLVLTGKVWGVYYEDLGETWKTEYAVKVLHVLYHATSVNLHSGMRDLRASGIRIPSSSWYNSNRTQMTRVVAHMVAFNMCTYSVWKIQQ